ncbi:alpha/beta hydrolase [Oceaniserpentilla sp. 4NH20-0058]|uniref:alpha/beta hydrolase n=1 Tax=Oceaniserpentilla sp. 4NH20-0058 TaxID=3127660 RepID=UPI003102909A
MTHYKKIFTFSILPLTFASLIGCGSSDDDPVTREHDERTFVVAEEISFNPLATDLPTVPIPSSVYYGTYEGLQGDAVYAAEIPTGWDGGGLIMYTHGFRGEGETLDVSVPPLPWRAAVLGAGYAWAASSYSANFYDARAGIEDTNKLALELTDYIETDFSVSFDAPSQYLISGFSLGGHIAAAAVDKENLERTLFPVPYEGSAPLCQAEENEFQWLGDYPRVMHEISGFGDRDFSDFQSLLGTYDPSGIVIVQPGEMLTALFGTNELGMPDWSNPINENGENLVSIVKNLTGGERPIFAEGFNTLYNDVALSSGGESGDINGILAGSIYDNSERVYRWTDGDITPEEQAFNDAITRESATKGANGLRNDGVRWIPLVGGDFDVPVLTLHTLGDMFVPFVHQQLYRQKAIDNGNEDLLVQRAIRATGHCDFSATEISTALGDLITWVNGGSKPAGDEVLDAAVVADDSYGCDHTITSADALDARASLPVCE